jgi:DNA-binding response OmpR family regulator
MARILIVDPSAEICELIAHVVARLGHEPVRLGWSEPDSHPHADLALIEPAYPESLGAAHRLRDAQPELPIVCLSIQAKSEAAVTALEPVAYVMKPFAFRELEDVLRTTVGEAVVPAA